MRVTWSGALAQAIEKAADAAVRVIGRGAREETVEHRVSPPRGRAHKKPRPHPEWMSQGLATRGQRSLPAPVRIAARIDDCRPASDEEARDTPPVELILDGPALDVKDLHTLCTLSALPACRAGGNRHAFPGGWARKTPV
jgi:hypothetical protein